MIVYVSLPNLCRLNNPKMPSECTTMPHSNDNLINSFSVQDLKERGNDHFKNNEFKKAVEMYDMAIDRSPDIAILYSNRSAAHIKLENFGYALADAEQAIKLDPTFVKAYHRAASSLTAMTRYREAVQMLQKVDELRPSMHIRKQLASCRKLATRQAFERAIHTNSVGGGDEQRAEFKIDLDKISFDEKSYRGTILSTSTPINEDFVSQLLSDLRSQIRLHEKFAYRILLEARDVLKREPTLVKVNLSNQDRLTICGDVHGQFYDLLHIFEQNGLPSNNRPYMFNGDFVDRGSFSVECILTLLCFKLLYPKRFYLNRGNHEVSDLNEIYGFKGEVQSKYSPEMYKLFTEIFNHLPLCHLINEKVLVVHGGIPADTKTTLADIAAIDRNMQPPPFGIMAELLWNDPSNVNGKQPSKRGQGYTFGPDISKEFCNRNSVEYIVRSHEVKENGYEVEHDKRVVTVFSAPNYCDCTGNAGAYIHLNGDNVERPLFNKFRHSPHPNIPPMAYSSDFFHLG
ncbi:hypothetical protein ACOME3_000874 [Neoechinorhynchus agilis]